MKTILLIDDNKKVITKLTHAIKAQLKNVNILTATSFKEVIKIMNSSQQIHVSVLEFTLPDTKQGEIVDFLLKKNIPTIVLTSNTDLSLKKAILEKDILDYFKKQDIKNIEQVTSKIDRTLKNYDCNILLVDDSLTQLAIAENILHDLHINVTKAHDGKEALSILENSTTNFDLILTDYNMPNIDGFELTVKIREQYKKDKLGVIVLSASDNPDIATTFLKIGVNDYINKPYNKTEFITRVNTTLENLELFKQNREMATKDILTGLHNRRFFFESGEAIFDKARRYNKSLAVAILDIDNFKKINDKYGHDVGDEVLIEVAKVLDQKLRGSDLIARFGGVEFCMLLENADLENLKEIFEKIRFDIELTEFILSDITISFSVSIGICYGLENNLSQMLSTADEQLKISKQNGRNRISLHEATVSW